MTKDKVIHIRVSEDVLDFLQKETLKERRSVSNFVNNIILDEKKRREDEVS